MAQNLYLNGKLVPTSDSCPFGLLPSRNDSFVSIPRIVVAQITFSHIKSSVSLRSWMHYIVCLVCMIFVFGCGYEQVASNLDQSQANEIVAVLGNSGITSRATADRTQRGRFSVTVQSDQYTVAIAVLNAQNLPKAGSPTFEELTRSKGLVPNSREVEAARLDYALAVEIEEKLREIPGVASVKVIVRANLLVADVVPGASVILETTPDCQLSKEEIQGIVSLAVPGSDPEKVRVVITPFRPKVVTIGNVGVESQGTQIVHRPLVPFLSFVKIPENEYGRLAGALLFCIIVAAGLGLFLGFFMGQSYAAGVPPPSSSIRITDQRGQRDHRALSGSLQIGGNKPPGPLIE